MAIYHCSIKIGSRAKGQSAVAASAYRSGEKLTDKETGLISDYTRKSGVVFSEIALCENAPSEYSNRETLWNAVHSIEKNKNAQLWREFEVALPKELNRDEQIETVRDFVNKLTEQGMCIDWALHDKGDGNPHAHIMATMRSIEPNGKWSPKSRKVYDLDENGERIFQKIDKSGRKQYKNHKEDYNDWNAKERVEEWRSAWADCCNARLAERDRIDHRSYERQGSELIPTIHEGYIARKLV
ncbi:MAG: MobA/MobL family protein, partial [Prevotella sp.]|nr:MobA/MobL family protein [Prevotella sp.]